MPPGGYTVHPKGQHARPQAWVTLSATLCRVCCQHFINEAQTGQLPAQSHTANQEWGQTSDSGLPGHCRPPFPGGDYGLGGTEQGKHHGPHEPPSDHLVFLWHRALCGAAGPRDGGHGHGSRAEGADRPLGAGPQHHPVHPAAGCGGEPPPPHRTSSPPAQGSSSLTKHQLPCWHPPAPSQVPQGPSPTTSGLHPLTSSQRPRWGCQATGQRAGFLQLAQSPCVRAPLPWGLCAEARPGPRSSQLEDLGPQIREGWALPAHAGPHSTPLVL